MNGPGVLAAAVLGYLLGKQLNIFGGNDGGTAQVAVPNLISQPQATAQSQSDQPNGWEATLFLIMGIDAHPQGKTVKNGLDFLRIVGSGNGHMPTGHFQKVMAYLRITMMKDGLAPVIERNEYEWTTIKDRRSHAPFGAGGPTLARRIRASLCGTAGAAYPLAHQMARARRLPTSTPRRTS